MAASPGTEWVRLTDDRCRDRLLATDGALALWRPVCDGSVFSPPTVPGNGTCTDGICSGPTHETNVTEVRFATLDPEGQLQAADLHNATGLDRSARYLAYRGGTVLATTTAQKVSGDVWSRHLWLVEPRSGTVRDLGTVEGRFLDLDRFSHHGWTVAATLDVPAGEVDGRNVSRREVRIWQDGAWTLFGEDESMADCPTRPLRRWGTAHVLGEDGFAVPRSRWRVPEGQGNGTDCPSTEFRDTRLVHDDRSTSPPLPRNVSLSTGIGDLVVLRDLDVLVGGDAPEIILDRRRNTTVDVTPADSDLGPSLEDYLSPFLLPFASHPSTAASDGRGAVWMPDGVGSDEVHAYENRTGEVRDLTPTIGPSDGRVVDSGLVDVEGDWLVWDVCVEGSGVDDPERAAQIQIMNRPTGRVHERSAHPQRSDGTAPCPARPVDLDAGTLVWMGPPPDPADDPGAALRSVELGSGADAVGPVEVLEAPFEGPSERISTDEGWTYVEALGAPGSSSPTASEIYALPAANASGYGPPDPEKTLEGRVVFTTPPDPDAGEVDLPDNTSIPLERIEVQVARLEGHTTVETDEDGRFTVPGAAPLSELPRFPEFTVRFEAGSPSIVPVSPFRVVDHSAGDADNVVEITTSNPRLVKVDDGEVELDLWEIAKDFASSSSIEGGRTERVQDAAVIYHRATQAVEAARTLLDVEFDRQVDVRIFSTDDGVHFNSTDGEPTINIDDQGHPGNSHWEDDDHPDNRVWHEFGHAVMWLSPVGGTDDLPDRGNRYFDVIDDDSSTRRDWTMWDPVSDPGDPLDIRLHPQSLQNQRDHESNHIGYANARSLDAWTEGYAEWFSLMVADRVAGLDDPHLYRYGPTADLEANHLVLAGVTGSKEEFSVASLLWDLVDPTSERDRDDVQIPVGQVAQTLHLEDPQTVHEIWQAFGDRPGVQELFTVRGIYENLDDDPLHGEDEPIGTTRWAVMALAEDRNDDGDIFDPVDDLVARYRVAPEVRTAEQFTAFRRDHPTPDNQSWWPIIVSRPGRPATPHPAGAFVELNVTDGEGAPVPNASLQVCLEYPDPDAWRDRCYRSGPADDRPGGAWLHLPTSYNVTAKLQVVAPGHEPGPTTTIARDEYVRSVAENRLRGDDVLLTMEGTLRPLDDRGGFPWLALLAVVAVAGAAGGLWWYRRERSEPG